MVASSGRQRRTSSEIEGELASRFNHKTAFSVQDDCPCVQTLVAVGFGVWRVRFFGVGACMGKRGDRDSDSTAARGRGSERALSPKRSSWSGDDFDQCLSNHVCDLFGASSKEEALAREAEVKASQPRAGVCPVQWGSQDVAFRCLDCELDSNCIQCCDCFFKAQHEGHEVAMIRTVGGSCDCGDPSSWAPAGFCPEHCETPERLDNAESLDLLPPALRTRAEALIPELMLQADQRLKPRHGFLRSEAAADRRVREEQASALFALLRRLGEVAFGLRYLVVQELQGERLVNWMKAAVEEASCAEELERFFLLYVQVSPSFKRSFAKTFIRQYEHILEDTPRLGSLGVQFFTIPEVALELVAKEDAFAALLAAANRYLSLVVDHEDEQIVFKDPDPLQETWEKLRSVFHTVGYVLFHKSVCEHVLKTPSVLEAIAEVLQRLWRMSLQHRATAEHVLYESRRLQLQAHRDLLRFAMSCLEQLEAFEGFSHVTILDASDNRHRAQDTDSTWLVSVARLSAHMPALRRLRLARNRLRRVERLGDLPKLQLLDVCENLLGPTPGAALHMIGNCSELRAIFVAGNPFVEIAEDLRAYRYQLLDLVPSLRFIDGEAVGKARPGVELSTAPEAFELNTKYYHPTEAGSQTESFELSMLFPNYFLMVKWPTSPLPVAGSHTSFGTGGAAYAFSEKRRTTSLPRAGRLARSASEGALATKRPKAALSPTLPKSLCRSGSASALREKTWPREQKNLGSAMQCSFVFFLEKEILDQFSALCDFCRRPQATLEELLPLYSWLVASLQDSGGFGTSFNDATTASFHMPALRLLTLSLNFELLLDPSLADSWRRIFPREFLVVGITHTVRTLRFEAEIRAGLWVRNGESMRAQHVDYRTKFQFRQIDIMTLQAFMILLRMHGSEDAACEPLTCLWTAVFNDATVPEAPSPAQASSVRISWQRLWVQSNVSEHTRTRFRLFWLVLCQVLNEMFPIEVAMCRRAWEPRYSYRCPVILQRFVIQVLASGPMSLSELANMLPKELQVRESQLAEAVEAVASRQDARYVLKQRSWQHFDICTAEAMPIRNWRDGTWRERQHRAEEKALAQQDVELGQGVASTLPPRPAASCSAHGLCAEAGLTSGDCCPTAGDGIYLKCCDAQAGSRRLSPLQMGRKGVTIDDTTLQWCAGRIPQIWPNLQDTPVGLIADLDVPWVCWLGIKILVGTPVTCIEADDDTAWSWTKELLSMLGTEHVMGLAVGNELELLYQNADSECIRQLWSGGRLWKTFQSRVTSVFTASVLTGSAIVPFTEKPSEALVNTFLRNAIRKYGKRYAFTFNVYPYFDPNIHLNPGTVDKCNLDLPRVICWDKPTCLGPNIMASARKQMHYLTNRWDDLFWIGFVITGQTLVRVTIHIRNGFLEWDLTLPGGVPAPDHIFYFTLRDSLNFGKQEHFGLLTSCYSLGCKIATPSFRPQSCALPELKKPPSWQVWGFAILGACVLRGHHMPLRALTDREAIHTRRSKGKLEAAAAGPADRGRGKRLLVGLKRWRQEALEAEDFWLLPSRHGLPSRHSLRSTRCDVSKETGLANLYSAWRTPLVVLFPDTEVLLPGLQVIYAGQMHYSSLLSFVNAGPWPPQLRSPADLEEVVWESGRAGTFVGFFRSPEAAGHLQDLWPLDCLRRHNRAFTFARWANETDRNKSRGEEADPPRLRSFALRIKEVQEGQLLKQDIELDSNTGSADLSPVEAVVYVRADEDACQFAPSDKYLMYQEGGSSSSSARITPSSWRERVDAFCAWCERQVLGPVAVFDAPRAAALDGTFDWLLLLFAPKDVTEDRFMAGQRCSDADSA
eukprot:s451_g6.t9